MNFEYEKVWQFTNEVFLKMGCSTDDAKLASDVLVSADLRGIDSHGVARLIGYVRLWDADRINPTPDIKVVHETPSTAVVASILNCGIWFAHGASICRFSSFRSRAG